MKVTAILSPRIMLNIQLLGEVAKEHAAYGRSPRYVNFNTGKIDQDDFNTILAQNGLDPQKVPSTSNIDVVNQALALAKADNVPLIISSTYHSAPKLKDLDQEIDLVIHDEAHYLVQPNFHECLKLGKARLCFTATQETTDSNDGLGMNNTNAYGHVLFTQSPFKLIQAGELVPPAIHLVDIPGNEVLDDDYAGMTACIFSAYDEHHKLVQQYSADPTQIAGKLLVTCDGRESLQKIVELIPTNYKITHPDVKVYALCSDWGIYLNGQMIPNADNKGKTRLLKELQPYNSKTGIGLKPSDKAIILHVDMIAEGLDVPGITGVMPIRNLGRIKFLQTLGRAARLHTIDRTNLYADTIKPDDHAKFVKPFAWVIMPKIMTTSTDALGRCQTYIEAIRNDWGIDEPHIADNSNGKDEEEKEDPEFIGKTAVPATTTPLNAQTIIDFLHDTEDPETIALNGGEFWHNDLWTTLLFDAVDKALNHTSADLTTNFNHERILSITEAYNKERLAS